MKAIASILAILTILFLSCAYCEQGLLPHSESLLKSQITSNVKSAKMKISVSCTHGPYNSVGYNWSHVFKAGGRIILNTTTMTLTEGAYLELYAKFKDNDKRPDIGSAMKRIQIDKDLLENGGVVSIDVYVKENSGRFSGNTCTWTAIFTIQKSEESEMQTANESIATESEGISVKVTAKTVMLTHSDGTKTYLHTGDTLIVESYNSKSGKFAAIYKGLTGNIKGIGLDYSKDQLAEMLSK